MRLSLANYIKDSRQFLIFFIILIISLFFSGCAKNSDSNLVICHQDNHSLYPQVVEEILPSYRVEQSENMAYFTIDSGAVAEAFDIQAQGALETGVAKYWHPQYLATAIIAVDRDQTKAQVTSWSDIFDSQEEIGFLNTPGNMQMLIAAMSYGLEGEDYSLTSSTQLLASLQEKNHLKMNSFQSPITLCFDYQAAALKEKGRNLEIIIPREGTFTYEKGLLSDEKLNFQANVDKLMFESQLVLLDGKRDLSLYPDLEKYSAAIRVPDYQHFVKTTENASRLIEREVLKTNKYMSIDNREHTLFALIYMIIITLWISLIIRRSMQKGISYAAFATGVLLTGWTFVRLIKYQFELIPFLNRYLWYSFYIFQLSLPLVLLWMAWTIDKPIDESLPPRWLRALAIFIGFLIIFVFTNDLHGYVFNLDLARQDWAVNYTYAFGYYIILFVCMINLLGVFAILVQKSLRNPRKKRFIFPISLFILFAIYNYKYIMRDPFVYKTDITIITGLFTLLMFESCIQSGLIPVNTKYIDFLRCSPLKIQIVNNKGETELVSANLNPINTDIIDKVIESSPLPILQDDYLLFSKAILGGHVILHEDISKVNRLYKDVQKSTQKLIEANALLTKKEKTERAINENLARKQLMKQLEAEIAESIKKLTKMIEELAQSENVSKETTRIALLLCYIKRRCNLFFIEKERNIMAADKLILYIDELSEIAEYSNFKIATLNEIRGQISSRQASLFYDFSYAIADFGVRRNLSYIVQYLEIKDDFLTMGFLTSESVEELKLDPGFFAAIEGAKGKIVIKDVDDNIGVSLSFPKGGVGDE